MYRPNTKHTISDLPIWAFSGKPKPQRRWRVDWSAAGPWLVAMAATAGAWYVIIYNC